MIKKTRLGSVSVVALLGGILTSLAFVDNPTDEMLLSDLILCLSGREANTSVLDLLSLSMQQLPLYVFCAIAGTSLYRHFCTASVLVFSRQPKRLRWYIRELVGLIISVAVFHIIFIGTVVMVTRARFPIVYNQAGMIMLGYHFLVHALWTCVLVLTVNMLSIYCGSDLGYTLGIIMNMVLITLLALPHPDGSIGYIAVNPISRLVLGWHRVGGHELGLILDNAEFSLNINMSVGYMLTLSVIAAVICGIIVVRHDLLIANKETGGI